MTYWDTYQSKLTQAHEADPARAPFIPMLTLRYEDVCADPDATLARVLNLTGLAPRVSGGVSVVGSVACGPRMGEHLDHVSPRELADIVALTRPTIHAFGYGALVDEYVDRRRAMSDDIALPWKPTGSTVTYKRMCTLPCDVAAQCPSWNPAAGGPMPGARFTTPALPVGEGEEGRMPPPGVTAPSRRSPFSDRLLPPPRQNNGRYAPPRRPAGNGPTRKWD